MHTLLNFVDSILTVSGISFHLVTNALQFVRKVSAIRTVKVTANREIIKKGLPRNSKK